MTSAKLRVPGKIAPAEHGSLIRSVAGISCGDRLAVPEGVAAEAELGERCVFHGCSSIRMMTRLAARSAACKKRKRER